MTLAPKDTNSHHFTLSWKKCKNEINKSMLTFPAGSLQAKTAWYKAEGEGRGSVYYVTQNRHCD